jgi:hypothetical protein
MRNILMVMSGHDDGNEAIKWKHVLIFLAVASIFFGGVWWLITKNLIQSIIAFGIPWVIVAVFVVLAPIFGLSMLAFMFILRRVERRKEGRK